MDALIIFKYQLDSRRVQPIEMPSHSQILSIQGQRDDICIWALVNPKLPVVARTFEIVLTGMPILPNSSYRKYLGTVLFDEGSYVTHIFERIPC